MAEKDIQYFTERLEKDTYSKDEVAGLLNSEYEYTNRKATENKVDKEQFETISNELNTYKKQEFDRNLTSTFTKLNGINDRVDDFAKIAGITQDMKQEDIEAKVIELKDTHKYDFFFNKGESGATPNTQNTPTPTKNGKVVYGNITSKASIWDKLKMNK